jgi:fumarate hydratase subunit beta
MATVHLSCPPSQAEIDALNVGDLVYLSGEIVATGGLPAHKRLIAHLESNTPLPMQMEGVFIHLPHMIEEKPDGGYDIHYVNPTTSRRFDQYMPHLIRALDLKVVGGKGGLGPQAVEAMAEKGCVYLSLLGGGSAILSSAIKEVLQVEWRDFPSHFRLSRMRVEELGPLTVGIDAHGNSIYDRLESAARARLPEIMAQLARRREAASEGC